MKLIHRMKILMAVIQELSGRISATDLHPYLFLYCHEFVEHNHYYDFIPQATGPYSLQAEADKETLINKGCLEKSEDWIAKESIERFAVPLDFFEKMGVQKMKNCWQDKSSEELQAHLQENYPDYFAGDKQPANTGNRDIVFYTIGYEGLSPEAYLNKLVANDVKLLCDVRKNAFSQKYGFSKGELKGALEKVGIAYKHIPDLGIISEKRQNLGTDKDYRELFDEYEKETLIHQQDKLDLLTQLLEENKRIAITCFEAKYHQCHRSRVARALGDRKGFNYKIEHL